MISRKPDAAVYMQLAAILRKRIRDGVYRPGRMMPSEKSLGEEFGLARETIRRAVREIAIEGLVVIKQGVGTTVVQQNEAATYGLKRGSTFVVRMPTPDDVAQHGVPQGIPILVITYGANPEIIVSAGETTFRAN